MAQGLSCFSLATRPDSQFLLGQTNSHSYCLLDIAWDCVLSVANILFYPGGLSEV